MSDTATGREPAAPARANRHGDPCPDWCEADHGRQIAAGVWNDAHRSAPAGSTDHPFQPRAYAFADGDGGASFVGVSGGQGAYVRLGHRDAGQLADIIEELAGMAPAQLRLLADAVRAAAAVAAGEDR